MVHDAKGLEDLLREIREGGWEGKDERGQSWSEQLEAKEKELAKAFARIVHLKESKENVVE